MAILNMLLQRDSENKIDSETLLEKLSHVVGLEILEKVVSDNFDRRHLLEKIALESHLTEEILLKKLVRRLHWGYLDDLKGLDFREIYEPLMISELRYYGIMPLVKNHSVIGYVCCDPSIVPEKYFEKVNQTKLISSWKNISKALNESEKLSMCTREKDFSKAKEVISLLASEVKKFNGRGLTVCFDEKGTLYKFKNIDGQLGIGKIDESVRENLQSYLIMISHSKSKEIIISNNIKYKLVSSGCNFVLLDCNNKKDNFLYTLNLAKRRYNALILDENNFFAEVLGNFLEEYSINTKIINNFCNLCDSITTDIDLVFCSSDFLGGSWQNVIEMMKKNLRPFGSSFILLTPDKTQSFKIEAIAAGADFCISKKGSTEVLRACLRKLISRIDQNIFDIDQIDVPKCINC